MISSLQYSPAYLPQIIRIEVPQIWTSQIGQNILLTQLMERVQMNATLPVYFQNVNILSTFPIPRTAI